jgi:hypothetical protein
MNRIPFWICAAAVTLGIVACGQPDDTKSPPPNKSAQNETVFDDLIDTKARAKQQTEQAMEQNKQKMDAAMKQTESASATQ